MTLIVTPVTDKSVFLHILTIISGTSEYFNSPRSFLCIGQGRICMHSAHDIALAADVKICKEEKCSHFIQLKDLLDGGL